MPESSPSESISSPGHPSPAPSIRPSTRARGLLGLVLGLVVGLGVGIGGTLALRRAVPAQASVQASEQAPKAAAAFQCPMHPEIIQDHPGDCPICGMALVPMEEAGGGAGAGTESHAAITIDAARQQLIGLRTEQVAEASLGGSWLTSGRVVADETRVRRVNVKVEGFVEKLFVDFTGKAVAKGAPLFSLYSPEFVSAQREFLLALKTQRALAGGSMQGSGGDLLEAARRRLALWDVPPEALDRLEKTGEVQRALTLRSPIAGVVTAKNVVEGARITPADAPLEITDLGRVWVQADVYASELDRARVGSPAQLSLQALPGRVFKGRVAFVDPVLDPRTRTCRVRLEFPNPGGALKPEMFGEVRIQGTARRGLSVPLDAVLDAGDTKVVFIALGQGRFEPREVEVGITSDERVEIRSGLKAGEEVVVGATFLVDSESRLRAALAQMGRTSGGER